MKKVFNIILFAIFFLINDPVYGQIPHEVLSVPSPNAAGIGLYGEYPVSHFTGIPNIEIPLYTLKEREISVPISLSYHASGFRPDQHPGWVGLGWTINAGGVITRITNDIIDEYNLPSHPNGENLGYYFNHNILNNSNWNTTSFMKNIVQESLEWKDTEPDEFRFNFQGYNGKFYLDSDGDWKVKCDKPVKVKFNGEFLAVPFAPPIGGDPFYYGYVKSFSGFTIIVEDGTQYVFGGTTDAIEYDLPFFNQHQHLWFANSWYLTKIISKNSNETVHFTYERDHFINQMYLAVENNLGTRLSSNGGPFILNTNCGSYSIGTDISDFYSGRLIAPVYLREIKTDNFNVGFFRSNTTELRYDQSIYTSAYYRARPRSLERFLDFLETDGSAYPACLNNLQWKKLDVIHITQYGQTLRNRIKSFYFNYTDDPSKRLTLLNLEERGVQSQWAKPLYKFEYDTSQTLPPYLANKSDHWGFYNNSFADIPANGTAAANYYNLREPNPTFMLTGTLNKITYPTGGTTHFVFEPNTYSKQLKFVRSEGFDNLGISKTGAGLRIKKIISSDPKLPAQKVEKEYFYVNNYINNPSSSSPPRLSSGVMGGQIAYYFHDFRARAIDNDNLIYSQSLFSSQSVLPASNNSQGSPIGYSEVTERSSDGSYTKYFYTNFENHLDEATSNLHITRTAYEPFTSLEEERGKIKTQEFYHSNDTTIKRITYEYIALNKNNEFVRSLKASSTVPCSSSPGTGIGFGTAYKFYTYSYLPAIITTQTFDMQGLNPVTSVESFAYDNPIHKQVTRSYVTDSKGIKTVSVNVYPQDYRLNTNTFINKMVELNNVGSPIEKVVLRSFTSGSSTAFKVISGSLFTYSANGDYISTQHLLYMNNPLNLSTLRSPSNFVLSNQVIIPMEANLPLSSSFGNFVKDDHYVPETNFEYDHEKIKSVRIYDEKTTANRNNSYLWDITRRDIVAQIQGADFHRVGYSSFEEDGSSSTRISNPNNWLYQNSDRVTSVAKTGLYSLQMNESTTIKSVDSIPVGDYIVAYWAQGGPATVSGGTILSSKIGTSSKDWTYYEHLISVPNVGIISLSSNDEINYIDEVRLFPKEAVMKTYTYAPLTGMTSSTDERGMSSYFEYDGFQRLINIVDNEGNIVERHDYHYQTN